MPFGVSISCSHFQHFSNAVAHLVKWKIGTGMGPLNYLDDYLFVAFLCSLCNQQVEMFLDICAQIGFPVSMDKTFWGTTQLTFLGLLIDTVARLVCILVDKINRILT